ncbi:hypothetical protein DFH06DRAFT_517373 [Mycena polygramma]|nr:hypothetical protein DFH06DRAFT_517373 [Mycena polygramma]
MASAVGLPVGAAAGDTRSAVHNRGRVRRSPSLPLVSIFPSALDFFLFSSMTFTHQLALAFYCNDFSTCPSIAAGGSPAHFYLDFDESGLNGQLRCPVLPCPLSCMQRTILEPRNIDSKNQLWYCMDGIPYNLSPRSDHSDFLLLAYTVAFEFRQMPTWRQCN